MKIVGILICIFMITSCSVLDTKGIVDTDYRKLITGTWAEYIDSGNNIKVYVTYFPDGRYHTYGYLPDDFSEYFYADGRWSIENGISCITIEYETMGIFEKGEIICNRIIKVNLDVFVFDLDGEEITMKKISSGKL